jgi:transposase
MYTVEMYARVRRAVLVEGKSRRAVAREFGLARKTIRKMLEYSLPPGYRRQKPIRRPKLGPRLGVIDAILEDDKQRPKKQRHTAKRIFERLRARKPKLEKHKGVFERVEGSGVWLIGEQQFPLGVQSAGVVLSVPLRNQ